MNPLLEVLKELDLIHWLMMMLGLIIHGLMHFQIRKFQWRKQFDFSIFFDQFLRPWLLALVCSTACLIAMDYAGELDQSWGAFISVFIGYTNSSFFKNSMKLVNEKIKKNRE